MSKKGLFKFNFHFNEQKQRLTLAFTFAFMVFAIVFAAILAAVGVAYLFIHLGWLVPAEGKLGIGVIFAFVALFSLVAGWLIAFFSSRIPLRPVNQMIRMMRRLSAGDFAARLEFDGALAAHPAFAEVAESFNKMAEELQSTELLRSDFINNFSHEFKTPIVSISGLAKLVNKGNLTEEQRSQYLTAIETESLRLAYMATNVLNLTKVENQTILSDINGFNLSEQIRDAILLLENKWSKKNIELQPDFEEYTVEANEEMLKQVWINLIDNAVKFTPEGGTVAISVAAESDWIAVTVSNTGSHIPPEKREKIFRKFYQADESHASEGNGIGLAIVKRIVELHRGNVTVLSGDGRTAFTVTLPRRQK
ncbi:MAG: HAMP domain-containing histidine kinase [Clostridia bacterium]|nr:HAMP domain-containing histidine kinase [Clostridia bacterium]